MFYRTPNTTANQLLIGQPSLTENKINKVGE